MSIHLSSLGNHDPQLLRAVAQEIRERDDLVAKVAACTGRTAEETLRNLRRLFAFTDEETTEPDAGTPSAGADRDETGDQ